LKSNLSLFWNLIPSLLPLAVSGLHVHLWLRDPVGCRDSAPAISVAPGGNSCWRRGL